MTADAMPATQQQAHFRQVTTTWRGQINSEDLTVAALTDVLLSAREAGMPGDALVSFPTGGDCVVLVQVQHTSLVGLGDTS